MSLFEKPVDGGVAAAFIPEGPTSPCPCSTAGPCACSAVPQPYSCGHYFPWHSVLPPLYCPICGSYIGPSDMFRPTVTYSTGTGPL